MIQTSLGIQVRRGPHRQNPVTVAATGYPEIARVSCVQDRHNGGLELRQGHGRGSYYETSSRLHHRQHGFREKFRDNAYDRGRGPTRSDGEQRHIRR